ncbi:type I glutamate--ammonia ligase [Streptomyces chattanoogensis]|uniref:type I glutamate--ammonia ligase n=1 Tax=Streptomyces chattanoogensis TaxID=66876 RepID=UPI003677F8C0
MRRIRDEDVKFLDIRFCDLFGQVQHFSIPTGSVTESFFTEGVAFDGCSIRGYSSIDESDMLLVPDLDTVPTDPFRTKKTLILNSFVHHPATGEPFTRDPRGVARKAERHLLESGIADRAYFGPEPEFYVFDSVRFGEDANAAFHQVDSAEGWWNTGREEEGGNLGYKIRYKEGYSPVSPHDRFADLRDTMVTFLEDCGIAVEKSHHEVSSGGQTEINYVYNTLLRSADQLQLLKYVVKNTAWQHGKTVTFMPKPLQGDNGNALHVHQSLWQGDEALFHNPDGYAGLSDTARHYIGGIMTHAPGLLAFTNPSLNSYHRLMPGFEAPVNLAYSQGNRSACVRIPVTGDSPRAKRIEIRFPDATSNPYLAFSALLMAGLDGIRNKIEPPEPIDADLYDTSGSGGTPPARLPESFAEAVNALEQDHAYLLEGGVFTTDLIETYLRLKREREIDAIRHRPHPYEFALSFDV